MMKKKFGNEIDDQETLERQRMKIEAGKIKEHKTTIESIKDTTKKETKDLRIERVNKLN